MSRKREICLQVAVLVLLTFVLVPIAVGQNTATADVKGVIYDATGAVVTGASVQLTNLDTRVSSTTTTTDAGEYFFRFQAPGKYKLTVKKAGFATVNVPEIVLQVSVNVQIPVTLKPGTVEQTVNVSTMAEQVNTTEGTLTHTVTNAQIRGLPIISQATGRTVMDTLPFLLPGITPTDPEGGADSRGYYMQINGNRHYSIAYNFEGGDNNDPEFNRASSPMPNPDMLQEFTVVTNNYKAELGRSGGGVVNAVAKSGTDVYHGNLRYYLSNEALDAKGFFDTITPRDRLNTFGGQFGGPVRIPGLYNGKSKTQFIFDYEETKASQQSLYGGVGNGVILPAQRNNGDFTSLITAAQSGTNTGPAVGGIATPGVCNSALRNDPTITADSAANAALGKYQYWLRSCTWPRNPLGALDTTGALTGTTGRPITFFSNGMVPTSLFNPISLYYLSHFIPMPNDPSGGPLLLGQYMPYTLGDRQYTIKINHKVSAADSIAGTFFSDKSKQLNTSTTNLPLNSHQDSVNNNYSLIGTETHVFSPRLVNQFMASATRFVSGFIFTSPGVSGLEPSVAGITGVHPQTTGVNLGLPGLLIGGTGIQITSGGSNVSVKESWQIKDDVSWSHGKHDLKFGYSWSGYIFNKALANNNGLFNFNAANTYGSGNATIDFLLGFANTYSQSTGQLFYPRQRVYGVYAQDDWRVTPTLTLNLGLRYDLAPPVADLRAQTNAFRPGAQSVVLPRAPAGMIFAGDPDPSLGTLPKGGYKTDRNNFAPRFGFAWAPRPEAGLMHTLTGSGKTSIRGAAGIFFDQPASLQSTQTASSQPYSVSYSAPAATLYQQGGTYANPFGSATNPFPWPLETRNFTLPVTFYPFDPGFVTAYIYQYNLTIQREVPWKMIAEVAYVGSNSFKLPNQQQMNPSILQPGATTGNVLQRRQYYCTTTTVAPSFVCPAANIRFSNIMQEFSNGRANYNGLQTRLARKFARGLAFDASYTYSKSLDDGTEPAIAFLGGLSPQHRWARGSADRQQQFVTSFTWDVPKFPVNQAFSRFVNGWMFGGIFQYRTGTPLDIKQSVDTSLTGLLNNAAGIPDFVGPWQTFDPKVPRTLTVPGATPGTTLTCTNCYFWYNPNAFAIVPTPTDYTQARLGNMSRDAFNGPGLFGLDVSLIKAFKISERQSFELRADATNVLNHPQTGYYPNATIGGQTSGTSQNALYGRRVQVSGRYTF